MAPLKSVNVTINDHLAELLSVDEFNEHLAALLSVDKFNDHLVMILSVTQTFAVHLATLLSVDEFDDQLALPMLADTDRFDDHHLALLLSVE